MQKPVHTYMYTISVWGGGWMFTDFKLFTDFVYNFQVADLQYTHQQQLLDKNNYALNKAMK